MPTYEYRCRDCGHELEAVQAFTDDALTECPQCAGSLRKVFGSIGVSFKGSGFYKTDHGSRANANGGSSESKSSSDSSSSSSSGDSSSSSTGDAKSGSSESKSTGDAKSGSSESKAKSSESK